MKKKVLILVAVAAMVLMSLNTVKADYTQMEMATDDIAHPGLGSQYWKRVNKLLCCDNSHNTPCRQSSTSKCN